MDFNSRSTAFLSSPPFPQFAPPSTSELPNLSDITFAPIAAASEEDDDEDNESDVNASPEDKIPEDKRLPPDTIVKDTLEFWDKQKRASGYTFERFLEGWLLGLNSRNRRSGPRMRVMRRVLKKPSIQTRLGEAGITLQFKGDKKDLVDVPAFRSELLALSSQSAFGKFDPEAFRTPGSGPCTAQEVCNTEWVDSSIREASTQMRDKSPRLAEFLSSVMTNERIERRSYNRGKADPSFPVAKAYMVTALLLSTYAPNRSNLLPRSIGIYLHSKGVKRRIIDTLAEFGICPKYKGIVEQLEKMGMAEKSRVRSNNQNSSMGSGSGNQGVSTGSGLIEDTT